MKGKLQYPTTASFDYIRSGGDIKSHSMMILSQYAPFKEAIESTVGKELLKDLIDMHSAKLARIASLDATDEEKIEYKILTELIKRWSYRIMQYENALKEAT